MGGEEVKDSDMEMQCRRRISRETSESAYRWDSKVVRKIEIVDIGNSVE